MDDSTATPARYLYMDKQHTNTSSRSRRGRRRTAALSWLAAALLLASPSSSALAAGEDDGPRLRLDDSSILTLDGIRLRAAESQGVLDNAFTRGIQAELEAL